MLEFSLVREEEENVPFDMEAQILEHFRAYKANKNPIGLSSDESEDDTMSLEDFLFDKSAMSPELNKVTSSTDINAFYRNM